MSQPEVEQGRVTVGLIGDPVVRSLSAAMHDAAFTASGLAERYALWTTAAAELPARVDMIRGRGMRGANVTIPHKTAVMPLLDTIDEVATAIGAVNTIVRQTDGSLLGTNTDGEGFFAALAQTGFQPWGRHVVLLGAGGSARAVAHVLVQHGAASLTVINRTIEHAEALLADTLAATDQDPELAALTPADAPLGELIARADLLVNATPVGTDEQLPLTGDLLHGRLLVVDLIYRTTPLLRAARAAGARTQDGLEMLVQQAALAWSKWTELPAPVDVMRAAAERARIA